MRLLTPRQPTVCVHFFSFIGSNSTGDQCHRNLFDKFEVSECHEWVYDTSVCDTTFISENNIVCNDAWKGPLSQSLFFFGVLVRDHL